MKVSQSLELLVFLFCDFWKIRKLELLLPELQLFRNLPQTVEEEHFLAGWDVPDLIVKMHKRTQIYVVFFAGVSLFPKMLAVVSLVLQRVV